MGTGNFLDLLQEVTHNAFMVGTATMTTLTLAVLAIAVRRILPKHKRDDTLPSRKRTRP
jgi:hypothetical protein